MNGDPMTGVLQALASGGIQTPQSLAARLELSAPILKSIVAALETRGYLSSAPTTCHSCSGCSLSESCSPDARPVPLLMLTAKGERAAAERPHF